MRKHRKQSTERRTGSLTSKAKQHSKLIWSVVSAALAAATIWAVTSQSRSFSFSRFLSCIRMSSKHWLLAAAACMILFVALEGEAITELCRAFGYPVRRQQGLLYSASDIYFSAITPSASGGQPACAFFMVRHGIPSVVATVALVVNLLMYTLAILVLGILALILQPTMFATFGVAGKVLILVGIVVQIGLVLVFSMLLKDGKLVYRILKAALRFLCRIRLLRHEEQKQARLLQIKEEYDGYAAMIQGKKRVLLKAFFLNLFQRAASVSITMFSFLAVGGPAALSVKMWCVQVYSLIGSNCVPIPGAMGVADYLMLDGFQELMPEAAAVNTELLSRSLSFYLCICLCGIFVLVQYIIMKRRSSH